MIHKNGITSAAVLEKKFRANVKGYDAEEVDAFLDRVIETLARYESFAKDERPRLEKAGAQFDKLSQRNQELEIELAVLKDKFAGLAANDTLNVNQNNLELHRRIGQLEKALYQLGQDPTKIK